METRNPGHPQMPTGSFLKDLFSELFIGKGALLSVRSGGAVAELFPGEAKTFELGESYLTIERSDWHLHIEFSRITTIRFRMETSPRGRLVRAVIFEDDRGIPVVRAALRTGYPPHLTDPLLIQDDFRFWSEPYGIYAFVILELSKDG